MRKKITLFSLGGAAVLLAGVGAFLFFRHQPEAEASDPQPPEAEANVVVLTPAQATSIGLSTGIAATRRLQPVRTTPGRLQYDDRRHVEILSSLAATLSEIRVKPGDQVTTGQVLAVLSSPEVGAARADVLVRESELSLAQQQLRWEQMACSGLERLVTEVEKGTPPEGILSKLKADRIGTEGEQILSAYAASLFKSQQAAKLLSLQSSGAIPEKNVQAAVTERDSAEALLAASIQESQYALHQQRDRAAASVADAERRLQISREQVRTLLGYDPSVDSMEPESGLSFVEVRAPFAGTIEEQGFSVTERVAARDRLFTLADTSNLWVAADIRESEWPALSLAEGQTLKVVAPAIPNRCWDATLYFVGREVEPATNSVPLVATIDNSDGLLRPGQFVRIEVPIAPPRDALAAPSSAIVAHEDQEFVFSPAGEDRYRRVDVETGDTVAGWTEIQGGLSEGDPIVTQGAFVLKSELLLVGEEE